MALTMFIKIFQNICIRLLTSWVTVHMDEDAIVEPEPPPRAIAPLKARALVLPPPPVPICDDEIKMANIEVSRPGFEPLLIVFDNWVHASGRLRVYVTCRTHKKAIPPTCRERYGGGSAPPYLADPFPAHVFAL